jgi:hypothetical protein
MPAFFADSPRSGAGEDALAALRAVDLARRSRLAGAADAEEHPSLGATSLDSWTMGRWVFDRSVESDTRRKNGG